MPVTEVFAPVALERILLATDFCAASEVAAEYAAALAGHYSSTLELVNVIDPSGNSLGFAELLGPALEELRHSAEACLDRAAARVAREPVEKRIMESFTPAEAILSEAQRSRADLIVLGTACKRGFARFILGSVAEEVICGAACPVLTVGQQVPPIAPGNFGFRRLLFASDLSPHAEKAFRYAASFAAHEATELCVCHVLSPKHGTPEEARLAETSLLMLREMAEATCRGRDVRCFVEQGEPEEAILTRAEQVGADLIVLGARRSSFWRSYVHAGLTPRILAEARCPVLTIGN